jgi:hypothetical protein
MKERNGIGQEVKQDGKAAGGGPGTRQIKEQEKQTAASNL